MSIKAKATTLVAATLLATTAYGQDRIPHICMDYGAAVRAFLEVRVEEGLSVGEAMMRNLQSSEAARQAGATKKQTDEMNLVARKALAFVYSLSDQEAIERDADDVDWAMKHLSDSQTEAARARAVVLDRHAVADCQQGKLDWANQFMKGGS